MRNSSTVVLVMPFACLALTGIAAPVTFNQQIAPIIYRNCLAVVSDVKKGKRIAAKLPVAGRVQ